MDGYSEVSRLTTSSLVLASGCFSQGMRRALLGWAWTPVLQSCRGWHMAWCTSVKGGHAISLGRTVLDSGPFIPCTALCQPCVFPARPQQTLRVFSVALGPLALPYCCLGFLEPQGFTLGSHCPRLAPACFLASEMPPVPSGASEEHP